MNFIFSSTGKLVYGLPYVARVTIDNEGFGLKKTYIVNEPKISSTGDVCVMIKYEAEKFEIIEERTGSCSIDSLASYNLVYRNRLITLGAVGDKRLEEHIYSFLNNEITVSKLLLSIDDDIREHCKEEIEQIFNEEKESEMDINKIDIANTLKEFMEIHEYVQLIFNDYHVIFNSNDEKVLLTFSNEENVYVETRAFKLNIKISKIDNFQVFNENRIYNKIILNMLDGTTITLIAN